MQCPFCPPNIGDDEMIVENGLCMFIQQPELVLVGSGMIIPKAHRETVFELTLNEWEATFELLQEVRKMLDTKYNPQGYNVGWNCGHIGGQTVFHAHLHVIPRYEDEPFAGRGIRYWLKQAENSKG